MDLEMLDAELRVLAEKKTALSKLNYNNEDYDKIEEELHQLEDHFQAAYGDYLEEVFSTVHEEYCPDSEVLLPIAYLADHYEISESEVQVAHDQGVFVEVDDYPGRPTKLVLIPSPTRIVLHIDADTKEEVWKAPSNS